MSSFSFVHVADIHLGYEQYNLATRREDFDRTFAEITEKTLDLKPDFMIIAGDLFHYARPMNTTLEKAITNFRKLKDAGIPVLAIDGGHDAAPNMITGTILNPLDSAGLLYYLPRHEGACWQNDQAYVYGVPNFRTRERTEKNLPSFYEIKTPRPKPDLFNFFVFHMILDIPEMSRGKLNIAVESSPDLIPKGFDYYAGGHIHSPWHLQFKGGRLVYSGSTETVSYEDAEVKKGFYHGQIDDDRELTLNRINLESPRKFKVLDKDYTGMTPLKITESVMQSIRDNDESGIVLVPVLRGLLPAESSRRELDVAAIRNTSEKALIVHPMILMNEQGIPEETLRSIFEGELKDIKMKSFQYFLQFFQQRYRDDEAKDNSHLALDLIPLLVKGDDDHVRKLLEDTTCEN